MNAELKRLVSLLRRKIFCADHADAWRLRSLNNRSESLAKGFRKASVCFQVRAQRIQKEINLLIEQTMPDKVGMDVVLGIAIRAAMYDRLSADRTYKLVKKQIELSYAARLANERLNQLPA